MPKHTPTPHEAARMARAAASELASLQRAMHRAEDNLAGLHRMLKVPNITPRRSSTKKQTTAAPFLLDLFASTIGGFAADSVAPDGNGPASHYPSTAQIAARLTNASIRGQRIL